MVVFRITVKVQTLYAIIPMFKFVLQVIYMKTDQHYTTNYDLIFDGLLDTIPAAARLVGHGDLLNLFPNHIWETYDIDSSLPCVCQEPTHLCGPMGHYKSAFFGKKPRIR